MPFLLNVTLGRKARLRAFPRLVYPEGIGSVHPFGSDFWDHMCINALVVELHILYLYIHNTVLDSKFPSTTYFPAKMDFFRAKYL